MGLNIDLPFLQDQSIDRWIKAKNIILDKDNKTPITEGGFDLKIDLGAPICGVIVVPDELVIFTETYTGHYPGAIYRYKNGVATKIIQSYRFPFAVTNAITGTHTTNSKGDLIISWTDGVTELCILNLDDLPFEVDANKNIVGETADLYSLVNTFPYVKYPIFSTVVESGGKLPKGSYWFFISYGLGYGTFYNWSSISSDPVYISNVHYASNGGAMWIKDYVTEAELENVLKTTTSNSIKVSITNIDTKFKTFKLGILYMNEAGVLTGFETEELSITPTISYTYTENKNEIGFSEILSDYLTFRGVTAIDNYQGDLIVGNIFNYDTDNIQKYVNNWLIWQRYSAIDPNLAQYPIHQNSIKTYNPGDVYSFNVHLIHKRGFITKGFRIPFNPPEGELLPTWNDTLSNGYVSGEKEFKILSTAVVTGGKYFNVWENENEVYSSNANSEIWDATGKIGDLTGNVKYHKFGYLEEFGPVSTGWPKLGIKVKQIYLPPGIQNDYQGFFISHVLREPTIRYGNLSWFGGTSSATRDFRFFNVDNLANKPSIGGFVRFMMDGIAGSIVSNISGLSLKSNRDTYWFYDGVSGVYSSYCFRLETYKYVPSNNKITNPANTLREEGLYVRLNSDFVYTDIVGSSLQMGYIQSIPDNLYLDKTTACARCSSVYPLTVSETNDEFKGDSFIQPEVQVIANHEDVEHPSTENLVFGFVNYSNINSIFSIPVGIATESWFTVAPEWGTPNVLQYYYNTVYNKLNSLKPLISFDPTIPIDDVAEKAVLRSETSPIDSLIVNWRLFPISKLYTVANASAAICEVVTLKDKLFIFTSNEVLIATLHDTLNTVGQSLKTVQSDLFDYKPELLVDNKSGSLGISHKSHVSKYSAGIAWFSKTSGKLYHVSESLEELTDGRISSLILNILDTLSAGLGYNSINNNPFTNGFSLGIDEDNKRLLFCINFITVGQTLYPIVVSYSLSKKEWVAAHDYKAAYISFNKEGLILLGGKGTESKLYLYNRLKTAYYNAPLISYIDYLFCFNDVAAMLYESIMLRPEKKSLTDTEDTDPTIGQLYVSVYNSHQFSGTIALVKKNNLLDKIGNYDNVEGVIVFNKFQDNLKKGSKSFILPNWNFDETKLNPVTGITTVEPYSTYIVNITSPGGRVIYNGLVYDGQGYVIRTTHITTVTLINATLSKIGQIGARQFISPYLVVRVAWTNATTIIKMLNVKVNNYYEKIPKDK